MVLIVTVSVQTIMANVVTTLVDEGNVQWTAPELARYYNDAMREVILQRPDASAETATLTLVAGFRQALPTTAAKLLDVYCNTSSNLPVTLVDRKMLDAVAPGWRAEDQAADVVHYLMDERDPALFEVYPPAEAGASLDAMVSTYPDLVDVPDEGELYTAITGDMDLPDIYVGAVQDYICFRAYSKESEVAVNGPRALQFLARFADSLGVEMKALLATSPRMAQAAAMARG